MERPRLAGSPKRKIYKRDNTALKSVCQGEMCGKMHFMWISTRKGSRRDAGAPYSLRRSTTRREISSCVDGVFMPPMATGKQKRGYSRLPLVRASLCGHFPPRRLRRQQPSRFPFITINQKPQKILKNEKVSHGQKLACPVSKNLSPKTRLWMIVARTFLELGCCGDRNLQKFCHNSSQWKQKANSDWEISGWDIRFPTKVSCFFVPFVV